jgi:tetratricopeptide (TPR) repeat protein
MTYLELNQPEKAFEYSKSVFANNAINEDAKAQLVKSLKAFVEDNPTFQNTFIQLLNIAIDEGESSASNEEKGDFYLKRNSAKALEFYQKALEDQPNNFELYQKVIVLQIDQDLFEDALATSKLALEVFPSQAVFYFYKGKSLYRLTQYDEAISVLKEALAYVFETSQLEVDSLKLLSEAYTKQGKVEKANTYQEQAKKAKKKLDEMQ